MHRLDLFVLLLAGVMGFASLFTIAGAFPISAQHSFMYGPPIAVEADPEGYVTTLEDRVEYLEREVSWQRSDHISDYSVLKERLDSLELRHLDYLPPHLEGHLTLYYDKNASALMYCTDGECKPMN